VLLGVLYVYFTRTAQRDDFAISFPTLNRTNAEFKQTAGLFTIVNPTLFNFGKALSFAELLQQIDQTLKEDFCHQPFISSEINRTVSQYHENTGSLLFDIEISYQRFDYDSHFNGFDSHTTWLLHNWEQTPLTIYIQDFHAQSDVKFDFAYNRAYFNTDDIKALQARFLTILEAVLKDSLSPIHTLPIMTEQEVQQLQAWNQTETDYPKDQTIVDLFQAQVDKTPNNIAVVFKGQELSYQELNTKANKLAHYLMTLGVGAETLVGICVERSLEMVVGLLGILKAGGAYVPLDPDYPQERLRFMFEDSEVNVLLSQSHLLEKLPVSTAKVVCLNGDWEQIAAASEENPARQSGPDNLAYVIYTSGSTGKPKGVMIEHTALSNFNNYAIKTYPIYPEDNILQFASINFDAAAEEIYPILTKGGTLFLRTKEMLDTDQTFLQTCQEMGVTILDLPTAYWQQLISTKYKQNYWPESVRLVIIGGEAASIQHVKHWQQTLGQKVQLLNTYGPTEATVVASAYRLTEFIDNLPIGKPLANTKIYILDTQHNPTPLGIPGELCIAGAGLARDYLNRPELTAEKFIEIEIFGKPQRIYKTGDLARWLPDGNIEYLGRIDHQVKLRGFRIELGEIEAVLSQHEAVKEAVVVLYNQEDNPRLVAYVTLAIPIDEVSRVLRTWLKTRLPDYMLPASFTVLEKLPLTPNGKIDMKALPEPYLAIQAVEQAAETETEHLLCKLWSQVLGIEVTSIQSHFFEAGGHSLLATQLLSHIRNSFGIEMPLQLIFDHPILQEQAESIEAFNATEQQSQEISDPEEEIGRL
jgi:amino acid adenylation domain-containing protein